MKDAKWVRNPIDAFVLQRLEREGLRPSPEADRATLLRRVTLDLTGLPPTPAELDAFLADKSPNAYEKVVDRLLRSPRYGERMAFPWLDAARYADSNGYQIDGAAIHVAVARLGDRGVQSQHAVRPVHGRAAGGRPVAERDAGSADRDRVQSQSPRQCRGRHHCGRVCGGIRRRSRRHDRDRVPGPDAGCARCHNHKYDPVTQKEFYQLFAYFNNVPEHGRARRIGNSPPFIAAPTPEQQAQLKQLDDQLAAANDAFAKLQPDLAQGAAGMGTVAGRSRRCRGPRLAGWSRTIRSTAT